MQFTLAAAALLATASSSVLQIRNDYTVASTSDYNSTCSKSNPNPIAKVVNRCDYDVHVWSIQKQMGCPDGAGLVLKKGDFYHENMRDSPDGETGISIKLSKFAQCGGKDQTQLEYFRSKQAGFEGNFLDISFVDCVGLDCPGREDGFYFKAGNEDGLYVSAVDNEHCPIFSVNDGPEAAAVSYINWNDRQTKWCNLEATMELHLCGGEEPDSTPSYTPAPEPEEPEPSSSEESTPTPTPVSSQKVSSIKVPAYTPAPEVEAAAITPAPAPQPKVVKTEVVYETVYVKEKRHAHAHAHGLRHQQFHA